MISANGPGKSKVTRHKLSRLRGGFLSRFPGPEMRRSVAGVFYSAFLSPFGTGQAISNLYSLTGKDFCRRVTRSTTWYIQGRGFIPDAHNGPHGCLDNMGSAVRLSGRGFDSPTVPPSFKRPRLTVGQVASQAIEKIRPLVNRQNHLQRFGKHLNANSASPV